MLNWEKKSFPHVSHRLIGSLALGRRRSLLFPFFFLVFVIVVVFVVVAAVFVPPRFISSPAFAIRRLFSGARRSGECE